MPYGLLIVIVDLESLEERLDGWVECWFCPPDTVTIVFFLKTYHSIQLLAVLVEGVGKGINPTVGG